MNLETVTEEVTDCLCGETPKFLSDFTRLRVEWPDKITLTSTTDVDNACRKGRVAPDDAHRNCYVTSDMLGGRLPSNASWGWPGVLRHPRRNAHTSTLTSVWRS